ncbi:zinc finger MYM-type protein 4-like [Ornithodoros turicata]|uniref:zinc finger MYM-type protein 4-like n=1 Tax=Ornithodoros turicata TaxID=34597 RepID=UPI0031389EAD
MSKTGEDLADVPVKSEGAHANGTHEPVCDSKLDGEQFANGQGEDSVAAEALDASSTSSKPSKAEVNGTQDILREGSSETKMEVDREPLKSEAVKEEENVVGKPEASDEVTEEASEGRTSNNDGDANSGEATPTSTSPRKVKKKKKVTKLSIMHAIAARLSNQGKATKEDPKAGTDNSTKQENDGPKEEQKVAVEAPSKETKSAAESKPESPSGPPESGTAPAKKTSNTCAVCSATKGLRYQVLYQGKTQFLCSDGCFKAFRNKQKLAPKKPVERKDQCAVCQKEIAEGKGYFPIAGECKPICSENCIKKYSERHGNWRVCAHCSHKLGAEDNKFLIWETMEYCGEECLSKYQTTSGSHCSHCNAVVPQTSLGKYCVRFGSDIRQFCSGKCLEEFKRGLKVCCLCQKDLSSQTEGFLAPVGEKGHFKDFCSQQCLERYEKINAASSGAAPIKKCSACNKDAPVKYEVQFKEETHPLCCELCVASFRYRHGLHSNVCENCHQLFDGSSNLTEAKEGRTVLHELSPKQFCSKSCVNLFVLSHRKIVPCSWCKVKKYNFDMIERVGEAGAQGQMFCSLNCLSLLKANQSASSSRVVRCDHCGKMQGAQYHLTMSDASIRNFCCYKCVLNFQSQFSNLPTLTTSAPTATQAANQAATQTKNQGGRNSTPIISSIMSLAPNSAHNVVPTTLQQVDAVTGSAKMPNLTPVVKVTTSSNATHSVVMKDVTSPTILAKPSVTVTPTLGGPPVVAMSSVVGKDQLPVTAREIIVQFPPPKLVKNKTMQCKPVTQSKGISCRPHPFHKDTQTEESGDAPKALKGIIPIPVPIYVPTPMHMYTQTVPTPIPFPIPIPVPIFIPTTKETTDEILETIKQIRDHLRSSEVYDQALLNIAHLVTGVPKASSPSEQHQQETSATEDSPKESSVNTQEVCDRKLKRTADSMDKDSEAGSEEPLSKIPCVSDEDPMDYPDYIEPAILEYPSDQEREDDITDYDTLKKEFGVESWSNWVKKKNQDLEMGSQTGSRRLKLFKTDLLNMTPEELNYALCLFIKEVNQPSGEPYPPTCIYVQCLGIQQYLFENERLDNVFSDPQYEMFAGCLNSLLCNVLERPAEPVPRISEEMLWEAKQLGAHSPSVLLNTIMYFSVKHFKLNTVKENVCLSFTSISKQWQKVPKARSIRVLRYTGRGQGNSSVKPKEECEDQVENLEDPLRCPIKLYEFYLSKCPDTVKCREDVFYMQPERSCQPDGAVWYSSQPLGEEVIARMLTRFCMVKEVQDIRNYLFNDR